MTWCTKIQCQTLNMIPVHCVLWFRSKTLLRLRNPIVTLNACVRELERVKLAIPFYGEKFSHMIEFKCPAVFISSRAPYSAHGYI